MNFNKLEKYLDSINLRDEIKGGVAPGSNTVIYIDHKKVFSYSTGYDNIARKTRVSPNRFYNIYSCSKITTAVAAMKLVEDGILKFDDPVSRYIPAFADIKVGEFDSSGRLVGTRAPKRPMTVRHLLTMTSGLGYNMRTKAIERVIRETDGRAPTLKVCEAFAEDPLFFDPGEHYRYSASLDVMGGVIEVASGMRFADYVTENIFHPLGMYNTVYHVRDEDIPNLAAQYTYNSKTMEVTEVPATENLHRIGTEYDGGGAGIVTTTSDYILLLDALANGGVGANGARIISSYAIDLMRTPALTPELNAEYAQNYNTGYGYALGVRTCVDRSASLNLANVGEFGWDGWKMCVAMVDPKIKMAVFHTENLEGFQNQIIPRLRNVIYSSLEG